MAVVTAGNPLLPISQQTTYNFTTAAPTDTTAPLFVSAATNSGGSKIIMTYDEALDATHAAGTNDFQVTVASIARTISSVSVNGSTVELTLASPITNGQEVTVAYNDLTPGNDPDIVQDAAGNDTASIVPAVSVTNSVPAAAVAPVFSSLTCYRGEQFFTLHFDVALDALNKPLTTAFSVSINNAGTTVSTVDINSTDKTVKITFTAGALNPGDTIDCRYTDPTISDDPLAIQALDGTDSPTFLYNVDVSNAFRDLEITKVPF